MWVSRRPHSMRLVAALTVLIALVAAGCQGTSATGGNTILPTVLQRGTLRIGTITGNAPFESLDSSNTLVGYDIDIATKLAEALGVKPEFIQTDVAGRVTVLQSGKADIVVGSFTRTWKRSQVVSFTDPINLEYVALLAAADSPGATVSDFNKSGTKVAVATGGTQSDAVTSALPQATAVQVPGIADELAAVTSGKADAAAVANTQIGDLMKANPGKFKVINGSLTGYQEDAIGVPLGDFSWWLYVNQFVHDINSDGTTYTLYQKWFGKGATPGPFSLPPAGQG